MRIALFVVLASCAGRVQLNMKRVAFDMQCDAANLQRVDLGDSDSAGIVGCGKQATYVQQCNVTGVIHNQYGTSPIKKCQWNLQNIAERQSANNQHQQAESQ